MTKKNQTYPEESYPLPVPVDGSFLEEDSELKPAPSSDDSEGQEEAQEVVEDEKDTSVDKMWDDDNWLHLQPMYVLVDCSDDTVIADFESLGEAVHEKAAEYRKAREAEGDQNYSMAVYKKVFSIR